MDDDGARVVDTVRVFLTAYIADMEEYADIFLVKLKGTRGGAALLGRL